MVMHFSSFNRTAFRHNVRFKLMVGFYRADDVPKLTAEEMACDLVFIVFDLFVGSLRRSEAVRACLNVLVAL